MEQGPLNSSDSGMVGKALSGTAKDVLCRKTERDTFEVGVAGTEAHRGRVRDMHARGEWL
jgi:hypothetical protein